MMSSSKTERKPLNGRGGEAVWFSFPLVSKLARLHQLNAIFAIFGASDRDKSLDLKGRGLRNRL